eukprot:TRINITY_DN10336_c0_g1_i1.p2 TRINITY_DN10336_c0_g1~~TRINITY_DN10336_c0_g1_i1.p2  ORF type:complete len:79 (-),score=12.32 TRINITY_DN10336_c0_g1_i1:17-253(-)
MAQLAHFRLAVDVQPFEDCSLPHAPHEHKISRPRHTKKVLAFGRLHVDAMFGMRKQHAGGFSSLTFGGYKCNQIRWLS